MAFLDETGLAELWSLVKVEDNVVKAFADTKAKIATGSYTGNGNSGSSNKNTLTFDFPPKMVFISRVISGKTAHAILFKNGGLSSFNAVDAGGSKAMSYIGVAVEFNGNTVSWYCAEAIPQQNVTGSTYDYVAIG